MDSLARVIEKGEDEEIYFPFSPISSQFTKIWRLFVKGFSCQECGGCCRGDIGTKRVWIDKEDIRNIITGTSVSKKYIKRISVVGENGRYLPTPCQFLENKMCTIYQYRPNACKSFPWVGDTIENGVHFPTLNIKCPAVKEVTWILGAR